MEGGEYLLDRFLSTIDDVQADGAFVPKWDGQRSSNRCTVVMTKVEVDYVWRQDSDDIAQSLQDWLTTNLC